MKFKKYHRRYPDSGWDYKAISTMFEGKEIIYYELINRGVKSSGIEIYGGKNYVISSDSPSYSRMYLMSKIPFKYHKIIMQLVNNHHKTKWSKKSYVNLN